MAARQAHNLKVAGSSPAPAPTKISLGATKTKIHKKPLKQAVEEYKAVVNGV